MKFLRFKHNNEVKVGYLSGLIITELDCNDIISLFDKTQEEIKALSKDKYNLKNIEFLTPTDPSKIICVGLNYTDHADELEMDLPKEPIIFLKPPSSVIARDEDIVYPEISYELDYEGELAIVIGEQCRNVSVDSAECYILGYTILNDVTARDIQRKDGQWTRAKSFDTFAPIGPVVETNFDFDNVILTKVNGVIRQDSNVNKMIFSPYEILSFISQVMTLNPGDIIATGTPSGVGQLEIGDKVEVFIEGIGILKNNVA
ncbi:fumarylacetoacetate hydrolase family protein [Methanobrevibacter sp. DSM 116169]|uniref:fumarylacetoacetate hydrolase family protein n=1 Tax=Methanobrevibacter sp. DSM 116169 TaxID=3242727 RepID=UPI0038FC5D24